MEVSRIRVPEHSAGVRRTSPGACLIQIDGIGVVRRWSKDAEAVFGYSRDRAEGLPIELLAPFLGDCRNEQDGWCRRVDGSVFRGLIASLAALDESAAHGCESAAQTLVITDITSRYMREQAALRVRERVDEVTTNVAHLAFFSLDFQHDDVDLWGAFADVVGWTGGTPPRGLRELMVFVHPDDRALVTSSFEATIANGAAFEIEVRVRADLGERWLLIAGSLVEGQPPRIVGAAMNVTPQRAQSNALCASEAKLAALLEATSDGIMTIDAHGVVVSLNPPALAMFRCVDRPLLHVPWYTLFEMCSDELPSEGQQEATGRRIDGTTFTLECGFRAFGEGEQRVWLVLMRDVTQHRLLERQVLDVSEQLQRQIGQDLHDGLGQLLTGTAFLTKGLQHSLTSEYQPQTQRIVELINLAIARVRSLARGLSPIHVEAQSLEDVLRHTVSEASELLGVACELQHHDFIDLAQPASIAQLCLIAREAITNAVRHGHAHHIVVRLSRQADRSVLSVEDDGVGIGEMVEGLGLRSMRYRAKMIGGELDIMRTRTGTTLRCLWRDA